MYVRKEQRNILRFSICIQIFSKSVRDLEVSISFCFSDIHIDTLCLSHPLMVKHIGFKLYLMNALSLKFN